MSNSAMRNKRFLAGVLAGAMALTVTPILGFTGVAGALEPATGDGSVCEDAPNQEPFVDVTDADPSQAEIECLVNTGITQGVTATTYEPNSPVTRRQMAAFLVRLADAAEENEIGDEITALPASDGETDFTDIADEQAEFQTAIDRLADAGIAQGVTATEFRPGENVTRRQMAKFIVRLQDYLAGEDATPANPDDAFTDDDGDSGEEELNILAEEGVFLGDGQGNVNPGDDITRRQMANVLVRKLQYHFELGDITRLFPEDDTNQSFMVSPAGAQENTTSTDTTTNEGAELFTFTGVDGAVKVELLPCANVTVNETGQVAFADADGTANVADGLGSTSTNSTVIESANGAAYVDNTAVQPVNGVVNVVVDSTSFDCAVVLIYQDADGDNQLDLDANDRPTEDFAIGGPVSFLPPEAPAGTYPSGDLLFFDLERNLLVLDDGYSYYYDSNDDFFYWHDQNLTEGEWESYLSIGDYIDDEDNAYARTDAAVSDFNTHDDTANAPTSVAATSGDFDAAAGDTAANDIRVTFTASTGGLIEDYTAYLYVDDNNAATACAAGTAVDINGAEAGTGNSVTGAASPLVFTNQADGTYCIVVDADTEASGGSPLSAPAVVTVDAVPNDTVAPTMTDVRVMTDTDTPGVITATDVIRLDFSESLEAAGLDAASATIAVTDPQGETFIITGTVVLSDNDATVDTPAETDRATFTVTAVTKTGGVGDGAANLPATIGALSAEFEDPSGNVVDVANSADKVIDIEL